LLHATSIATTSTRMRIIRAGYYFGGMRSEPSRRIVSPFK
jgi:hypothetical protein